MKTIIFLIIATYTVQLSAKDYPASDLSLVTAQEIDGGLYGQDADISKDKLPLQVTDGINECIGSLPTPAAGAGPMGAGGVAGSLIKIIADGFLKRRAAKKIKKLERLQKISTSSYSLEFVLDNNVSEYKCGYIARSDSNSGPLNAYVVFRINHTHQGLLYVEPMQYWAKNTTAHTRKVNTKKGEKESVGFHLSASLQGVQDDASGIPQLFSTGSDARYLGQQEIRTNSGIATGHKIDGIKLGPIPTIVNANAKLLRIAVTEQGDIGFDVEEKIARTQALSEALGPIILSELETQLKKAGLGG